MARVPAPCSDAHGRAPGDLVPPHLLPQSRTSRASSAGGWAAPTARWMTGVASRPQLGGWRPTGATTAPAASARVSGATSSRGWGFSGPQEVGGCRRMCSFLKRSLHKASLAKPRRLLFSISAADSPQPSINSPGSGFWNFPGVVSHILTAAPRPVPAAGL